MQILDQVLVFSLSFFSLRDAADSEKSHHLRSIFLVLILNFPPVNMIEFGAAIIVSSEKLNW